MIYDIWYMIFDLQIYTVQLYGKLFLSFVIFILIFGSWFKIYEWFDIKHWYQLILTLVILILDDIN